MDDMRARAGTLEAPGQIKAPDDQSKANRDKSRAKGPSMRIGMEPVRDVLARWARICAALRSTDIQDDDLVWLEDSVGRLASRCWIERRQEALDAGFRADWWKAISNAWRDMLAIFGNGGRSASARDSVLSRIRQRGFCGALIDRSSPEQNALLSILKDPQALLELEGWASSPDAANSVWPSVLDRSGGGVTPMCLDLLRNTEVPLQNSWRTGDELCPRIEQTLFGDQLRVSAWFPEAMIGRQFEALLCSSDLDLIRSLEERAEQSDVRLSRLLAENWEGVFEAAEARTSRLLSVDSHDVQFELPLDGIHRPLVGKLLLVGLK